jgi:opacity protein-like surface antigen
MLKRKISQILSILFVSSITTIVFASDAQLPISPVISKQVQDESDPTSQFNEARLKELNPDCGQGCTSYPPVKIREVKAQPTAPLLFSATHLAFKEGWYVGLGLSLARFQNTDLDSVQTLSPPNPADTYLPATLSSSILYEASVGYQFSGVGSMSFPAYRLALLYQGGTERASGTMWTTSVAAFARSYTGDISTQSLFLTGQLDLLNYQGFAPYIEGGLGLARHQLSNYQAAQVTGLPYPATIPAATNSVFAWLVGGGVGYHFFIQQHELVANLGLRYMDKGAAESGPTFAGTNPPIANAGVLHQSVRDTELTFNIRYML